MIGAELAVQALRREGVRDVFGLPGTTIMGLIDAVGRQPGMRWLSVRHEQVAAVQRAVRTATSGRPGPVMVSLPLDSRYYVPAVGLWADAPLATAALLAAAGQDPAPRRRARAEASRAAYLTQVKPISDRTGGGVASAALTAALGEVLGRRGAVLVQDAPSLGTWIHRYVDFTEPGTFYAAPVVTVCGDGSFWMVAQDLEMAVRERLPVVAVINNNFAFGNTRDRQAVAHGGRYLGVFYGNPDFAAFARLLGAHGERVERDEDLLPALNRALDHAEHSGLPAVVDVIQDRHEGLPPDLVPPAAR